MCKREMTLGEEIIGLSTRGIDTPTVERMYRKYIEMTADNDKQLPLMKQRRNRVAYYDNECEFGWLRNATKKEFSSAHFAGAGSRGTTNYYDASYSRGVRPEIWLVK
jgi:hypothetical protein